jgi:hypothetical protein
MFAVGPAENPQALVMSTLPWFLPNRWVAQPSADSRPHRSLSAGQFGFERDAVSNGYPSAG